MNHMITKKDAGEIVSRARFRSGTTWTEIANKLNKPAVWTTAALLGQHPMSSGDAHTVGELLQLDDDVVEVLQVQPYRGSKDSAVPSDPTLYRFHEALQVYGPAIKELIHEEFGDGIMSAINFKLNVERRTDPAGDRVVVTLDGKFLDYQW
ncbi:MAG: cyanase [Rhodococcus sp. (in: high G+C Gram-positive bacteria)]